MPIADYTELLRPGVRARYEAMRLGYPLPELPESERTILPEERPKAKRKIYPEMKAAMKAVHALVQAGSPKRDAARKVSAQCNMTLDSLHSTYCRILKQDRLQEYIG